MTSLVRQPTKAPFVHSGTFVQSGMCGDTEGGMDMKVDPDILRAFAGFLDDASERVSDTQIFTSQLREAFLGTDFSSVSDGIWDLNQKAKARIAARLDDVSNAAKGSAESYDVTDSGFTARMRATEEEL